MITIKVPCSSANIGPGFDVIGLALSLWLEIQVTVGDESSKGAPHNCRVTYEGQGKDDVDLQPNRNLITQTALYVLRCHDKREFPEPTHVHIKNPIPLGRGLGSSGAAVVAGVSLGNEAGKLGLSKDRILDFCLMIERHPDNVAAALYGGFVGSYLKELDPEDMKRKEIPLAEVLPAPQGGEDTGLKPPIPPLDIGKHIRFPWASEIKCIAIIPDFEVSTAKARGVLPTSYEKADVIYNLQRVALLTTALGQSPPNAELIYDGMQDKVHQPYRKTLIPGLTEILKSVTPTSHPGLLGICLSGAGPTILALATSNFDHIAQHIIQQFGKDVLTKDEQAVGWLGMTWLYPAEITPLDIRAPANAIATTANWIFNFMVVMVTPVAFASIGYNTYTVFACINAFMVPCVYFFFPETAYRSLEEMDEIFHQVHGFKGAFDVVRVAREKPHRYGKKGELLIAYDETEEAHQVAERRRSSIAAQSMKHDGWGAGGEKREVV